MADILIDNNVHPWMNDPRAGNMQRLQVDVSSSVLYMFFLENDAGGPNGLFYRKSTDGGQTWGSRVTVAPGTDDGESPCIWFDKWTPGDTGTKIHISWQDNDDNKVYYRNLDTSSDTLSTAVVVATLSNVGTDGQNITSITKAKGGNLYIYSNANDGGGNNFGGFYRSVDNGANWTSRSSPFESDQFDKLILVPANLADTQDIWALFGDDSANAVSLKTYDDSANSWSEAAITNVDNFDGWNSTFSASILASNGHIILAICTAQDSAAADLLIYDITDASTITAKTNIITNADDWSAPKVYIDQNTGHFYVAWLGKADGSETWNSNANVWYSKSTDGGTTWSAAVKISDDTLNRLGLWISHGTPGANAGRFYPIFYIESAEDIYGNYANSIAISAGGGGSAIKTINGLAKASVKTVNGLAIASVKTWNGLA